jgi:DNA mismatch endonuclease (patch repair protein)
VTDIFSKAKRSEVMSRIRSRGNRATELRLVALMRAQNITGWRRHVTLRAARAAAKRVKRQPAKTSKTAQRAEKSTQLSTLISQHAALRVSVDFVFRRERVAIFVDGCFWHGCPRHATMPRGNRAFWKAKLERNKARDHAVTRALRAAGWRVIRIWECALSAKRTTATMRRIVRAMATK